MKEVGLHVALNRKHTFLLLKNGLRFARINKGGYKPLMM